MAKETGKAKNPNKAAGPGKKIFDTKMKGTDDLTAEGARKLGKAIGENVTGRSVPKKKDKD